VEEIRTRQARQEREEEEEEEKVEKKRKEEKRLRVQNKTLSVWLCLRYGTIPELSTSIGQSSTSTNPAKKYSHQITYLFRFPTNRGSQVILFFFFVSSPFSLRSLPSPPPLASRRFLLVVAQTGISHCFGESVQRAFGQAST